MHKPSPVLAAVSVAASLLLMSCHHEPTVITANGPADTQAADLAKAKPVALPPSITASKSYRCADNSIIGVDFMSDNKSAVLHVKKGAAPTPLTAAAPGEAFTGNGYSVKGSGGTITYNAPGKGSQSCTA